MNRGSALISALFVMTLVAIAATAISVRLQWDIYRAQLTRADQQLNLTSQMVILWAVNHLATLNKLNSQQMVTQWQKNAELDPLGIVLNAQIVDLQSRFNLNNLADKRYAYPFVHFLKMFGLSEPKAKELTANIYYWIIPNEQIYAQETLGEYYQKLKPAYAPSYQALSDLSEFRMIKGVTPQLFVNLSPYVTTLPERNLPINILTASKPVLYSLNTSIKEEQVEKIIALQHKNDKIKKALIQRFLSDNNIPATNITFESNYFLVQIQLHALQINRTIAVLLHKKQIGKKYFIEQMGYTINGI